MRDPASIYKVESKSRKIPDVNFGSLYTGTHIYMHAHINTSMHGIRRDMFEKLL